MQTADFFCEGGSRLLIQQRELGNNEKNSVNLRITSVEIQRFKVYIKLKCNHLQKNRM